MRKDRLGRLRPACRERDEVRARGAAVHLRQRPGPSAVGDAAPTVVASMNTPDELVCVDPTRALEFIESGSRLLDVREDDEWLAGHAPAAEHRPLGLVDPADYATSDTIVLVCRSGGRSAKAAAALQSAGLTVVNLEGGMTAWAREGRPVVRDDGTPGTIA
ncbi:rhodanese-like domain-containing protein [Mycolicibacterium sp. 050158]|uniref:rhodanese-like domain-containing protein n=1 Tax=Mycolicibacterium sp. 050158 TaxID=3090602 RepID=UPI0039A4ED5B